MAPYKRQGLVFDGDEAPPSKRLRAKPAKEREAREEEVVRAASRAASGPSSRRQQQQQQHEACERRTTRSGGRAACSCQTQQAGVPCTSLLECFSPDDIKRHLASLRREAEEERERAQLGAHKGLGKAFQRERQLLLQTDATSCAACGERSLLFEPTPLYCLQCNNRVKKGHCYWFAHVDASKHYVCSTCYKDQVKEEGVKVEGKMVAKSALLKGKNEEKLLEPWVQCDFCDAWVHQVCALFNKVRDDQSQSDGANASSRPSGAGAAAENQFACPNCLVKRMERGVARPIAEERRPQAMLEAKDLERTNLSNFLEDRIAAFLAHERRVRAKNCGKRPDQVPTAEGITVRIVNANDKTFSMLPNFREHFASQGKRGGKAAKADASALEYRSKTLLLFQKVEGVDLCLFCMHVQEYGKDCRQPNTRRAYLSYLDSVRYFKPDNITAFAGPGRCSAEEPKPRENPNGDSLRTLVYQELVMGYLQYLKNRGFTSMYIWACPPLPGEDYIFYVHPQRQKTPKSNRLREWYLRMLKRAKGEGIIEKTSNLWDLFFEGGKEHNRGKGCCNPADLPYFEGDYIPGALEEYLKKISDEREEERKAAEDFAKKESAKKKAFKGSRWGEKPAAKEGRSLRGSSKRITADEPVESQVMARLGDQIKHMKDDFIMVHLQPICSHCGEYVVAPKRRFTCRDCPNVDLCGACYFKGHSRGGSASAGNGNFQATSMDDKAKHASCCSPSLHRFKESPAVPRLEDTSDADPAVKGDIFETRQTFLGLCQGNHYQFDTFRRAKHSSMMVLFHLHNPTAPTFLSSGKHATKYREIQVPLLSMDPTGYNPAGDRGDVTMTDAEEARGSASASARGVKGKELVSILDSPTEWLMTQANTVLGKLVSAYNKKKWWW